MQRSLLDHEHSSAGRCPIEQQASKQRSRITNGTAFLPGIDNRSAWCRRAKDVVAAHLADMGGEDSCSAAEHSIVRRIAVLTVQLEALEVRFAVGEAAASDTDLYIRGSGSLRRLLEVIGIKRVPKNITPSLAEYVDAHPAAGDGAAP